MRDRTAREVFDELPDAARSGDFVLQINHPRTGRTGYFDQLGFDPATGVRHGPGYDAGFDALEVWNGRNVDGAREGARRLLRAPAHAATP